MDREMILMTCFVCGLIIGGTLGVFIGYNNNSCDFDEERAIARVEHHMENFFEDDKGNDFKMFLSYNDSATTWINTYNSWKPWSATFLGMYLREVCLP